MKKMTCFVNKKNHKHLVIYLMFCFSILSCHPMSRLIISDGNNYYKKYNLETENFAFSLEAIYSVGMYLSLKINIENISQDTILYELDNAQISTTKLVFKDTVLNLNHNGNIQVFSNKKWPELKIEPDNGYKILIEINTEIVTTEQFHKLWPWPEGEKMEFNPGDVVVNNDTIAIKNLYFLHESEIKH